MSNSTIGLERDAVTQARALKLQTLASLGLAIPDDPQTLLEAQAAASVDRAISRAGRGDRTAKAILRCQKRAT